MLGKRLRDARIKAGITQKQLGDAVGLSQQAINQIESGEVLNPRRIEKIAQVIGVNAGWLRFGNQHHSPDGNTEPQINSLPLLTDKQISNFPRSLKSVDTFTLFYGVVESNWFATIMQDDSMHGDEAGSIPEGATLIVRPSKSISAGKIGIFNLADGEVVCRRFRKNGPEKILQAINKDYGTITDPEAKCIGKVEYAVLFQDFTT